RCSARRSFGRLAPPSAVLRSPRTPAAQRPTSPSAYTARLALTWAVQTGLSCSAPLLARVLRPLPRRSHRRASDLAPAVLPSPRHDRLGLRIVALSRLQASLHVAARVLAPRCAAVAASRAFGAPLGRQDLSRTAGACFPALRRLPGRDWYPLERRSVKPPGHPLPRLPVRPRHDAPCPPSLPPRSRVRGVYSGRVSGMPVTPVGAPV